MGRGTFICANKIIDICNELKVLLEESGTFDAYRLSLLGKLQRLSLEIMEEREDAKLSDVAFITTEKGAHIPIKDGKAVGGPMKGMDFSNAEVDKEKDKKIGKNVSEHYNSPIPFEKISAEGENEPCVGFSKKGLKKHKGARHGDQYSDMTAEEYQEHAVKFLKKKCGPDILGYRCSDGAICRFNRLTGEFAKGYPGGQVKTCFFPTDGKGSAIDLEYALEYFNRKKRDESYDG